ncbi:MAG: Rrf2 family transcriptional regulator [Pseudomonadota bacterium]
MKLSTRSRYGTRILVELATQTVAGPMPVSRISRNQGIPVKYMEQLIRKLKSAGLIESVRGARGGHTLARDAATISLGEIVRLFEGPAELVECVKSPKVCDKADTCRVRSAWEAATEALFIELDKVSIADLACQS